MSTTYYKICKKFYDKGTYSADDLCAFVRVGKLTEDEYYAITGFVYPATSADDDEETEEETTEEETTTSTSEE